MSFSFSFRVAALTFFVSAGAAQMQGGVCVQASLQDYVAQNFTCTIGDKTFSGFLAELSTIGLAPSNLDGFEDITVTPTASGPRSGFSFGAPFNADGLLTAIDFRVGYNGVGPVESKFYATALSLTDAQTSGLGTITAAEAVCFDGEFTNPLAAVLECGGTSSINLSLQNQITNGNLNAAVEIPFPEPFERFSVVKNLSLEGSVAGEASVSAINNDTDAVPEPSTASLLLVSSGVILVLMRRMTNGVPVK